MTDPDPDASPLIHVVDDDAMMRRSVVFLLDSIGWDAVAYASAEEFLAQPAPQRPGCLVLDIRMPTLSGLELQQQLAGRGDALPVIFITGHADVSLAVQAMKSGACDLIEKPFRDQVLLDAVSRAVRTSRDMLRERLRCDQARRRLQTLSPREREVADLLARGQANKRVALALDISERTVHIHRQHVMDKLDIRSAAELARLILAADPRALD
ncbi:response regulator transcription factor [Amphibiibacter pelophylacis]|uniref:Response regulator n=1 Tax=Amphibiibacter pelophylacis TaxID=1799477 RepID=A0ACC6NYB8_9BURK